MRNHRILANSVLFIFNPLISTILGLGEWDKRGKYLLFFFIVYYGSTIGINEGGDVNRYKDEFESAYSFTGNLFEYLLFKFEDGEAVDFYLPILNYICSRFTSNFSFLFAFAAAVYGFFYVKCLDVIIRNSKYDNILGLLFLLYLATVIGFWYLQYLRFFTASIILQYCVLVRLYTKQNKWLLAILTPFIHFAIAPLVAFFILQKYLNFGSVYFWFILYFMCTKWLRIDPGLFNEIELDSENSIFDNLSTKQSYYIPESNGNEDIQSKGVIKHEAKKVQLNWYITYKDIFIGNFFYYMEWLAIVFNRRISKSIPEFNRYFIFYLQFAAFGRLFVLIPQGTRLLKIATFLKGLYVYEFYNRLDVSKNKYLRFLSVVVLLNMFFYIVVTGRIAFDSMSVNTVFGGPILAFFFRTLEPAAIPIKALFGF